MKKQRFILIAAVLAAVSLSSACSLIYDSESSDSASDSDEVVFDSSQSEPESSADRTEELLPSFIVCSAVENSDGTYTLKRADGIPIEMPPALFELDGKLYQIETRGPGEIITYISIDLDTVKMESKTDDNTIEFKYLDDGPYTDTPAYLSDFTLYWRAARSGNLKYERGGRKLDYWNPLP